MQEGNVIVECNVAGCGVSWYVKPEYAYDTVRLHLIYVHEYSDKDAANQAGE